MNAQTIVTPAGERMVVVPEEEYRALVEAAEDAADLRAVHAFDAAMARGEEELLPAALVDRLLNGESPIKVWREHRNLTQAELADRAGISKAYLSQIEGGTRQGGVDILRTLAETLDVLIDDLV
ncbi:helix-turn-helix domain-containing protein [Caulobacter mirabilis]|uniref:Transcriptional regulator n=1 Tax=Caulobacter mirabilis TaxID=69666 RepID=A0A2D2AVY3_9CAUL|nr:helix-turn-helix domain-containing protein [Caulobacter mirabilis]ATQ42169.1 transcriptional regulator [Caulobacter mirabilis]